MRDQKGFTLAELLISLGIISIISTIGISNYVGYRNQNKVRGAVDQIVANLREVSERSKSQQDGEKWGLHFVNPDGYSNDYFEIFKGDTYASSTVVSTNYLDKTVSFTDPYASSTKDIIFSKITGSPESNGSIVVDFQRYTGIIFVKDLGRITSTIEEDLVGYWNLDSGSGTIAYDRANEAGNGSLSGGPSWGVGKNNNALDFTGSTQTVTGDSPTFVEKLSVMAWVNPTEYPTERSTVVLGNMYYMNIHSDGSSQAYWYGTSSPGYHSSGASTVPLNEWTHIANVWDGTNVVLYVNGVARNTVPVTGDGTEPGANTFRIGAENASRQFMGKIDDVRIYDRALSVTEVQAIYNSTK
ncbi:MAG: hypothetical protein COT88_01950 [Candidatus Colwellbacteria bacterium CG10_big_fil_rev_8_21_14_0_10_41_28]|uniref:LamG-like jellyroll fold domain-containing protein n=1 Tax=Candidatus Colwellbacteria bacterium CG10_big_fil_rev_8_21_14_0_10_41_28 TaxID=1974539 RepID=A0A2H0VH16_9BACT|nr:MAG: hypothetical protein COT88_01950 [Candidatus Colwellbacteria bacterium CG10_big_fil_rev_8_21_14_0_10_41_28]